MNEWLSPVLGLIGTLVVAGLGFFQWRKTAERKRQSEFESKRAQVLQGLVERLQDVQLVSRDRTSIGVDINDQVKPINEYLIRNQIWLEPEDGQFAKQYMNALLAFMRKFNTPASMTLTCTSVRSFRSSPVRSRNCSATLAERRISW